MKQKLNYYKISTIILALLVISFLFYLGMNFYSNSKIEQGVQFGQLTTLNQIINEISTKGYVTIYLGEENLTLIPSSYTNLAREQTILEIMEQITKEGYVSLYSGNESLILVPYIENTN